MGHYAAEMGVSEETDEDKIYNERKRKEAREAGKNLFNMFIEKHAKDKEIALKKGDIIKIHSELCKNYPTHDSLFHYSKNGEQLSDAEIFAGNYGLMTFLNIKETPYEERLYTVLKQNEDNLVLDPGAWQHLKKPELSIRKNQKDRKNIGYFDKRIFIKAYNADIRKTLIQKAIGDYTTKNTLIALIKRDKISAEVINNILQQNKKK